MSIAGMLVRGRRRVGSIAAAALLLACGTTQSVRPLGAGRSEVDLSMGGPIIEAVPVPAPFPLVGYRRGLDDRSDVFGRLHLAPAVFGTLGIEAGVSRLFLEQRAWFPAWSASAQALFMAGKGGALAVPALSVNASWATGSWLFYAGTQEAVSFGERLNGDGPALHWAPYGGATRDLGRWRLGLELRWWDPMNDRDTLVYWHGLARHGALAPMFSVTRTLGDVR